MTKSEKIEEFLKSLGEVKRNNECLDGFLIACKKCGSTNVAKYDDIHCGSELTGCWGDAGLKCLDCGNAAEISSM
jgi:hypothetical protein